MTNIRDCYEKHLYVCMQMNVVRCGVVWCGVVWCGVVWCGVVWCGVVWCGVVWYGAYVLVCPYDILMFVVCIV